MAQARLEDAVGCFERALSLRPGDPTALYNLATARKEQGRLEDAAWAYGEAIGKRPGYAEAHHNLGMVLKVQGKAPEAAAALREAIRLKPDYAMAHLSLAALLLEQGDLEAAAEARTTLAALLEAEPGNAEARKLLGDVLLELGLWEQALATYEALRKPRVSQVQLGARERGKQLHLAAADAIAERNARNEADPERRARQMDWIYRHDVVEMYGPLSRSGLDN